MTTVQAKKIARRKLSLLQLAQELGNVSKACRIVGYSRQHFHEIRRNFQVHGAEGLLDRLPGAKGPHPNRVAPPIEKAIPAHALKHPTHGAQQLADELMLRGLQVSSGGVRGVWIRNSLKTRHERLLRLEETVRKPKIKLTEEQILALERFDPEFRERHIEVHATGELVADTFFAGTLKGRRQSLHPDRARLLQPPRLGPAPHLEDARDRRPDPEREAAVQRLHRAVSPHLPRGTPPDQGPDDLVRDRRGDAEGSGRVS